MTAVPTWDTCPCWFSQVSHSIKVDNSNGEVHLVTAETAQEGGEERHSGNSWVKLQIRRSTDNLLAKAWSITNYLVKIINYI